MDFQEADRRYAEIKRRHEAGELTQEEFDEQLKELMVQDEEGRWWVKSRTTGEWHYHDGTAWVKGTPPGYQEAPQAAPDDELVHETQPEQPEPTPSGPQVQDKPSPPSQPESGGQPSPVRTPPPAGTPTRDQNGGEPRRRVPVWPMAAAVIVLVAIIGGIVAFGQGGSQQGGSGQGGMAEFTVSYGPSDSMTALVDRFNKRFEGEYKAVHREMPADTGQYFDLMRTEFQAGGGDIDVITGDVIWPASFAAQGWIVDLSDRFPEEERKKFLDGPVQANTYDGKVWGVPWYTDAGLLYYRKDLLEQSGFSEPPKTWDELKAMALKTKQDTGIKYGFVFQGANYEGGVVDGLEYIYSHGGQVLDPNDASKVIIDSPESVAGLTTQRSMIADGVAPEAVANFTESESSSAFLNGDAVFCRDWSYIYALAGDPESSSIKQGQIGVAPLPAAEGGKSVSGLGGWSFYINSTSDEQDAAWEFIRFATSAEQQKILAMEEGLGPTRKELYKDQEVLNKLPVAELGREAFENAQPRPKSPYYGDMSFEMAEQFNASLKGEVSPEQAIKTLQTNLTSIVEQEN